MDTPTRPVLPRPALMLVTEPHPELLRVVAAAVDGGANVIHVRDKGSVGMESVYSAVEIHDVVAPAAVVLVNARHPLPATSVDGWHFRESAEFGPAFQAWHTLSHDCEIWGQSVHSCQTARGAEQCGADYLVAGSIYDTASHPGQTPGGLEFLQEVCEAVRIPVIAIGGITPENTAECIRAGAAGIAVLSGIMRADDPRTAALAYREALEQAWLKEVVQHDSTDG